MTSNTPKAQAIGAELRSAREASGLSMRQVAEKLDVSHVSIHRWEIGQVVPRTEDVSSVLTVVGASTQLREEIIRLARDPDSQYWIASSLPDQQRQLATLLEIEREAISITTIAPLLVPGLLQTAGYARAIMVAAEVPASEVDMRVAVRLGRRDAITRETPAALHTVIGEWVLDQVIGDSKVMATQLRTLLQLAELPNVDLRVLPTRTGWNPALEGPFVLAEFANRQPLVHIENRRSGQFLHEPSDVQTYRLAIDKVWESALQSGHSLERIAHAAREAEQHAADDGAVAEV